MAKKAVLPPIASNGHANRIAEPMEAARPKAAPKGSNASSIIIPGRRVEQIPVMIRGIRPLVVHQMDVKGIRQMANKWFQLPALTKEKKDPEAEYQASKYVSPQGWEGMHAGAFRAAMVGAARMCDKSVPMTLVKRIIFIEPDGCSVPLEVPLLDGGVLKFEPKPLIRIVGEPTMRTDMITVDSGAPDIRFRAQYMPWSATLRITYNANMISASQVINLLSIAGDSEGVGDIRPSAEKNCTGDLGRWEVVEG